MHPTRPSTLTLLIAFALALLLVAPQVSANPNAAHHRMQRKRSPQDPEPSGLVPLIGPIDGDAQPISSASSTPVSVTSTSTTSASTSTSVSNLVPTPSSSSSSSSASSSSSVSSSSSLSVSSASSSSSSVTPVSTTSTPAAETTPAAVPSTLVVKNTTTQTATADQAEGTEAPATTGAVTKSSIAVTVLIAVGASIGGIVIIWTIYRRYQAARSNKVDTRMQPIDFSPTGFDEGGVPGEHRRHSGASFNSFNRHGSDEGHSVHGHSAHGHAHGVPDHDFTAGGPANLAPVGGYADLARGGSPQPPQMQEMGSGAAHQGYSSQVPLHHQGGAYDQGVTPLTFKY